MKTKRLQLNIDQHLVDWLKTQSCPMTWVVEAGLRMLQAAEKADRSAAIIQVMQDRSRYHVEVSKP